MMESRQINLLIGWLTIAFILLIAVLLSACSEEYMREKYNSKTYTDLNKYCIEFPKDAACQGKESK